MVAGGVAFSSVDEGVYTCRIRDENSVRQTLYIGVYTSDTYQSSGVCYTDSVLAESLLHNNIISSSVRRLYDKSKPYTYTACSCISFSAVSLMKTC